MSESIESLKAWLENAVEQVPAASVESAIMVYQAAQAEIDAYAAIKDAAKQLITDVMSETGQTSYTTSSGRVAISAPSVSISYDAKAIDILLSDDPDLAMRLSPYRKVTERAGTLRITAKK